MRKKVVVLRLDGQRYGLMLSAVEHIVRAVEITSLPGAPGIVLGVINAGGTVIPVLDLRKRLGLPPQELAPEQHFVIANTIDRQVALIVDDAQEVAEIATEEILSTAEIVPGLEHIQGIAKLPDGLVLIHDLQTFLSEDEARALDRAMNA